MQKFDARQVISRDPLPHVGGIVGRELDDLLRGMDKEFNVPCLISASYPTADSKVNFLASQVEAGDVAAKNPSPINSLVPSFAASTIDFQTGVTTGGTFNISFPNSTVGFFRRVGFTLDSTGTMQVVFSPEAATLGAVANPGTVFVKGGLPVGWIDIEATAATPGRFKTAGSATNIIQNKVSGSNTIHRIENMTSGNGDVVGPASSTNNGFAKFDGTTGSLLKDSPATISNADVDAAAAIAHSKLAALPSANLLVGNASNVPTATPVTGDISITNGGVTAYAGTVPLNRGGTGQTTKAPAFDALSPLTAAGQIIYGGASGTGTALSAGVARQSLTSNGASAPSWATLDQSYQLTNLTLDASISSNQLVVALKTIAGADASAGDPISIAFRNATLATGSFGVASITGALSITLGTTTSLGLLAASSSYVYIYAVNNSGTVTLGASAHPYWDEGATWTTTTTTTSNANIYQASGLSGRAVRLIGRIKATWSNPNWGSITEAAIAPFTSPPISAQYSGGTTVIGTSPTTMVFTSRAHDNTNIYNTSTGEITIPVAGVWDLKAAIESNAAATGSNYAAIQVFINGSASKLIAQQLCVNGVGMKVSGSLSHRFALGDVVTIRPSFQTSSAVFNNTNATWFSIERIGN